MMRTGDEPLTGRAAGEALGTLMRLAASGQRFDSAKVNGRLRSSVGRGLLRRRVFAPYARIVERGAVRAPRPRSRRPRAVASRGSTDRPQPAGAA